MNKIVIAKNKFDLHEKSKKKGIAKIDNSEKKIDTDVLVYSPQFKLIEKCGHYNRQFSDINLQTDNENIYFGGSIIDPEKSFVHTVQEAHQLSFEIHNKLSKANDIIKPKFKEALTDILNYEEIEKLERISDTYQIEANVLEYEECINSFKECVSNYTEKQAINESNRCLKCNYDISMDLNYENCTHCGICVDICPKDCFSQNRGISKYSINDFSKNLFCEIDIKEYFFKINEENKVHFDNKKDCIRCFECVRECPYDIFTVVKVKQRKKWINEDKFVHQSK